MHCTTYYVKGDDCIECSHHLLLLIFRTGLRETWFFRSHGPIAKLSTSKDLCTVFVVVLTEKFSWNNMLQPGFILFYIFKLKLNRFKVQCHLYFQLKNIKHQYERKENY